MFKARSNGCEVKGTTDRKEMSTFGLKLMILSGFIVCSALTLLSPDTSILKLPMGLTILHLIKSTCLFRGANLMLKAHAY